MIEINKKEKCSGCTACASVCPISCIDMLEDTEGFKYPVVDKSRCLKCHKCEEVCPVINKPGVGKDPVAYLVRTKNTDLLMKCASGGVFSQIAMAIVDNNGVAYGAVYNGAFEVHHDRVTNRNDVERLASSKYVQSDMGNIFQQVKRDAEAGKTIVFCGTPCQVAGLRNYLKRSYDNLLLIDLVCHGVPSAKLWHEYLRYCVQKYGKIQYINFRSKHLGYHVSVMEERYLNGITNIGSARTNLMSKCFFKNVADRPICYECPFKTKERCSDLTIFDGWHAKQYVQGLKDDDKGYTIALAHTTKGSKVISDNSWFEFYSINSDTAIELDGKMLTTSVDRPILRDDFYKVLDKCGIKETVELLLPVSKIDLIIERVKIILYKTGMLKIIKSIKMK